MGLFLVHASMVFDYSGSVVDCVQSNKHIFVDNYIQLLKKAGKLEKVEKKYPSSEQTALYVHNLCCFCFDWDHKDFFVVDVKVSLKPKNF